MLENLYYILLCVALITLLQRRQTLSRLFPYIFPLLLLAILTEGARSLYSDGSTLQHLLFSIYTPAEYALLSLFYVSLIHERRLKLLIWCSILPFILFSFFVQFALDDTNYFYKYLDVLVESPLLVSWVVVYFIQLFRDDKTFDFSNKATFWISAGNLLFYAGSFFSYGFSAYLHNENQADLGDAISWIARFFNLVLYSAYIIGFRCSTA